MTTTAQQKARVLLEEQPVLSPTGQRDDVPWVALQLFTAQQMKVMEALKAIGLTVFVPMEWVVEEEGGQRRRTLRPVVRNLLFLKDDRDDKSLSDVLAALPYPIRLVTVSKEDKRTAKISADEMFEFQAMCNPDIITKRYVGEKEARLKKGDRVKVTHGPLKGLEGRLVRANKKYYLLKEVPGLAVMMKVTRWCCEPLHKTE